LIESAAYDLIKAEGFQLGIEQGIEQGICRSIRKLLLHGISAEGVARLLEIDIQTVMKASQSPETEH
jgi:predicted transposase YdaD